MSLFNLKPIYNDKELLKFASEFSNGYRNLPAGDYFSENKKYTLRLKDFLTDEHTGNRMNTNVRVGVRSGIMEFDKEKLNADAYTDDFIFYMIIWCVFQREIQDIEYADKISFKYYLDLKKPAKALISGFYETIKVAVNVDLNKRRAAQLNEILKEYKAT